MQFREPLAIYQQIGDQLCQDILERRWRPGERLPSVRELAVEIAVNPNTVVRSYAALEQAGIIRKQRGVGYFVSDDAEGIIREQHRAAFLNEKLPVLFQAMDILDIDLDEIAERYRHHQRQRDARPPAASGKATGT